MRATEAPIAFNFKNLHLHSKGACVECYKLQTIYRGDIIGIYYVIRLSFAESEGSSVDGLVVILRPKLR